MNSINAFGPIKMQNRPAMSANSLTAKTSSRLFISIIITKLFEFLFLYYFLSFSKYFKYFDRDNDKGVDKEHKKL